MAPSVSLLEPGANRFGFALFDRGNRQIGDLEVALYVAGGIDETAHGPFEADYRRIEVDSEFQSRNSARGPGLGAVGVRRGGRVRPPRLVRGVGGHEAGRPAGGGVARAGAGAARRRDPGGGRPRGSRPYADGGVGRRERRSDRDPRPARLHARGRSRRRARAREAGGAAVLLARAVREPRVRPGHRRRRAGEVRVRRRGRLHPRGVLRGQRRLEGRALAGRRPGGSTRSRGCSRSTPTASWPPASRAPSAPTSCATRCAGRCAEALRAGSRPGGAARRARSLRFARWTIPSPHPPRVSTSEDVERIAHRVERLRGLRFKQPVRPLFLDREEAVELLRARRPRRVPAARSADRRGDGRSCSACWSRRTASRRCSIASTRSRCSGSTTTARSAWS